jgi:hypothetical protein
MLFVINRCAGCTIEKSINGMEFGAYRIRSIRSDIMSAF